MFQTVAGAIRDLKPSAVVFALDGGHEHRTALLPTYKAHRPEPESGLQLQKTLAERAITAAGFQSIRVPGFEADDVIASIARQQSGVVICSSDKDLLALCNVARVYYPWSGGKFVTAEDRLELPAGQVTDFLALCGDTSDGIPGVKGIGEKTALALLQQFPDLETILAAATTGQIPGSVGKKLKEQRADALKCRQIVELRDNLKLPELSGWRPPFDWRSQLQAMNLASVEAIVNSLTPVVPGETGGGSVLEPPSAAGSLNWILRAITEQIRTGLSVAQLRDCPAGELITAWECGRVAAGRDQTNPWKRDAPQFIAWQQGFEGFDLSCPLGQPAGPPADQPAGPSPDPATATKPATQAKSNAEPKAAPKPATKKTGSLF